VLSSGLPNTLTWLSYNMCNAYYLRLFLGPSILCVRLSLIKLVEGALMVREEEEIAQA
jgi:hypothetical protein